MSASECGEILTAAGELSERGVLSASGHGNVSLRLANGNEILYSAAPNLRALTPGQIVHMRLDGTVLSGQLPALSAGAASMHLTVYRLRDDVGSVVHTHSPFATAYAVSGRRIDCWAEPLSIFGMSAGIPLVPYAPRGSRTAIENISRAVLPATRALLLQNHGVLAFGASVADAVHVTTLVEEAAQSGVYASVLGGPLPIPPEPAR